MFSQTVEYALRAVVALAARSEGAMKTHDISAAAGVPVHYLFKVLQTLAAAGIVKANRGVKGGYSLNQPASQLTVLQIINAIDPLPRIERCPLNRPEHAHTLCALHRRMDEAVKGVEDALGSVTIAEINDEAGPVLPLPKRRVGSARRRG